MLSGAAAMSFAPKRTAPDRSSPIQNSQTASRTPARHESGGIVSALPRHGLSSGRRQFGFGIVRPLGPAPSRRAHNRLGPRLVERDHTVAAALTPWRRRAVANANG